MSYIESILFESEQIQFRGRVHPVIYLSGMFYMFLSVLSAKVLYMSAFHVYAIMSSGIIGYFAYMPQILTGLFFVIGLIKLIKAFFLANFTELAVTNFRVIAKFGVYQTTTIEMDKIKIAGVVINQTIMGKMLNYGSVTLKGFAGNIAGMPPISKPYELQKHIVHTERARVMI